MVETKLKIGKKEYEVKAEFPLSKAREAVNFLVKCGLEGQSLGVIGHDDTTIYIGDFSEQ